MPQSKLEKQNAALNRNEAREKRGHKGQIAHLDALFGPGQGAAKERARLKALVEEGSKPKKKEPQAEAGEKPKRAKKTTGA